MKKIFSASLLVILVVGFSYIFYFNLFNLSFFDSWPRLIIAGQKFKQIDLIKNLKAYQKQSHDSAASWQVIIESLTRQAAVKKLLLENKIVVTQAEVDLLLRNQNKNINLEQLNKLTTEIYGWTSQDFYNYVLWPLAEKSRLQEKFNQDSGNNNILESLTIASQDIKDNPENFVKYTADNFDSSKDSAGYIGWVELNNSAPQIELFLLTAKPGQISEPISADNGYYLIKLIQSNVDNGKISFEYSQISRAKKSFEAYVQTEADRLKIIKLFSDNVFK